MAIRAATFFASAIATGMLLCGGAQASLVGDQIQITEYYPNLNSAYGAINSQIVPYDFINPGEADVIVDITGNQITISPDSPYTPSSAAFNGFEIHDYDSNTTINNVSLDNGSLLLPASYLFFDLHDVFVNLENINLTGNIIIDVASTNSSPQNIPEPPTLALLGTSLAGLGVLRRRKPA